MKKNYIKLLKRIVLSAGMALSGLAATAQTVAVSNIDSRGTWSGTYEMGNEFTVSSPIYITSLGAFDLNSDGMPAVTPVTIWDNGGSVVVTADVPAGTAAALDNGFRYTSITPTYLAPGTYRMSSYSIDGYSLSNSTGSATTATEVTITTGYYLSGSAGYPTTNYTGGDMFGANFYFTTAPTGTAAVSNQDSRGNWTGTYEMGNEFTVNSPIEVTFLGAFDRNSDGLPSATPVTIWDNSGSVVVTTTVPAGTTAPLDNEFRYMPITPTTLAPGTYRMSSYSTDGYSLSNSTGSATTASEITITTGYYLSGTAGYPTTNYTGGDMFGANFYFNPLSVTSLPGSAAVTDYASGGATANTTVFEMGIEFTVNTDVVVNALGAYDMNSDGLAAATPVTIWDNGGGVVAQVTVPAGTTPYLDNEMRYEAITPVILSAGNTYRISSYGNEGYKISSGASASTSASEISVVTGYYNVNTHAQPTTQYTADLYGANFLFNSALSGNAAVQTYNCPNVGSGTYEIGMEFTVNSDIDVISLGAYDQNSDGLAAATPVTIWEVSSQNVIAQATVPAGTAAPLENEMRYVAITPVTLTAGNTYRMTAYGSEGYMWGSGNALGTTATEISLTTACYNTAQGYPATTNSNDLYGANFHFTTGSGSGSPSALQCIKDHLLANESTIMNSIPSLHTWNYDGTNNINDGGGDMYDGGNVLNTNIATNIPYTAGAITASTSFGTTGEYFTLEQPGFFVMVAEMDNVTSFEITGNNGADGGGSVDEHTFSTTVGGVTYDVYIKRVYGTSDPSINHIMMIPQNGSASHTYSTNTDNDLHTLNNINASTRLHYVLISRNGGGYIDNYDMELFVENYLYGANFAGTVSNVTACGSAVVNGTTYTSSQSVETVFAGGAASGCDSASVTILRINQPATSSETMSSCTSVTINGNTYTTSQTVVDVFSGGAANGCDSTHTTNLTISNAGVFSSSSMTACVSAVINGNTYTTSQAVVDVFANGSAQGCDSTHTTNLTILNPVTSSSNLTACNSAIINGTTYTTSQAVVDVFSGGAANGCDSTHTTNLTITTTAVVSSDSMTSCGTATINGNTYTSSQTVVDTLGGAANGGCDSVHTTYLTITNAPANDSCSNAMAVTPGTYFGTTICASNDNEVTCGTDNGNLGGVWYTYTPTVSGTNIEVSTCNAGTNFDTKIRVFEGACGALTCVVGEDDENGACGLRTIVDWCGVAGNTYYILIHGYGDSEGEFEMSLTESAIPVGNSDVSACGAVTINGNVYSTSQVVTDTLSGAAASGCDSIAITNFTLTTYAEVTIDQSGCDSVNLFGNMYYATQVVRDTVVGGSIHGCDSITIVNLSISNAVYDSMIVSTCNSTYFVGGANQTTNGVYSDTHTGMNGCDSIVVTTLTLNASGETFFVDTAICQGSSIMLGGAAQTTAGTYYDTLTAVVGTCDSIVVTTLTINPTSATTLDETINAGETFTVGTTDYTTAGTHTTVLTAANGCDSIVTLNLTVIQSIAGENLYDMNLYPNPTTGLLNLEFSSEGDDLELVRIVDIHGKELMSITNVSMNVNNNQIDMSELSDGVYFVETTFNSGAKSIVKVVKLK